MTYTVDSPIIHAPTGTLAEALAWFDIKAGAETEYATELWRLAGNRFDPAIAFAQWAWETGDGSSARWQSNRNPAGLGIESDSDKDPAKLTGIEAARLHAWAIHFASSRGDGLVPLVPESAIPFARRWVDKFRDPNCPQPSTIADLGKHYVDKTGEPQAVWGWDPNYANGIVSKLNAIFPNRQEIQPLSKYSVVGLPGVMIELPVPLAHDIIPLSQSNQRPGIPRQKPGYWVQHETDNHAPGADAAMHNTYLHNGAEGREASWHFTVDDGIIYQHIPIDEVTWQAADGAGPGNMSGISCELCVNAGIDTDKARHNAEALCAGIMKALGLGIDRVKAHYDFNEGTADRHHCPDTMLNDGYWPVTFKANVAKIMRGPGTVYATPLPITWQEGDYGWKQLNKTPVFALEAEVECVRATTPLAWADGDRSDGDVAPAAGPKLKQGERVKIIGSFAGKNAKGKTVRWLIRSGDNARLVGNSFRPLLPVTQ